MIVLRRVGPALILAAVLGLLALTAGCGADASESDAAPGFSGGTIPFDTRPFELAGPNGSGGSTTLPEGVFADPGDPAEITTTTGPGALVGPDPSTITSLCGFEQTIAPFIRLPEKSPSDTESLMNLLLLTTARYGEIAPPSLRDDLVGILSELQRLREVLAANGWDPRSDAFQSEIVGVGASAAQPDSLGGRLQAVVAAEQAACR